MTSRLTRLIAVDDLATVIHDVGLNGFLDELIARMVSSFGNHEPDLLRTQKRGGFDYDKPTLGLVEWMPAMELGQRVSVKTVGYHPSNPVERGLPSVYASTAVYDTLSGRLVALCDATLLTALRTGAASAVATDILAIADATTLGIVGCGAQAVTQTHAISRVRPIARVLAFDANQAVADTLANRLGAVVPDIVVETTESVADVAANCDVLCTATSVDIGAGPVFEDQHLRPWLHVNAVGADFPGKTELPLDLLRRARVYPDYLPQCLVEGEAQLLCAADLEVELPELVEHRTRHVQWRSGLTVFDSTGWSLEDYIAVDLLLGHCERLGIGREIALQVTPEDPFDPYELLHLS